MNTTNIFDPAQLQTKEIVMTAIFQHYGWKQVNGTWVKGEGRDIPTTTTDKMKIKRHDFFVRKHMGADLSKKFFDSDAVSADPFKSNFKDVTLPAKKFYVMTGLQLLTSAGVVGAGVDTLNFGKMAQTALETGTLKLEVNSKPVLENQSVQSLFENEDSIPGYFRFPNLVVLEPNEKMEAEIRVAAAIGDFWADFRAVGYIVE